MTESSKPGDPGRTSKITLAKGLNAGLRRALEADPKVLLAGAGVGVTPLRALAEGLAYAPGDAVLLDRFTAEPLFVAELQALVAEKGLRVLGLPGPRRRPDSVLGPAGGDDELATLLPADLGERPRFGADERPATPHVLLVLDGVELTGVLGRVDIEQAGHERVAVAAGAAVSA